MKKSLKIIALKSILYRYVNPKSNAQNAKGFSDLCNGIFAAIETLGIENFSIRDLLNFNYVISIAKKMPDSSLLKICLLSLPGMKQDLTYDDFSTSYQYSFLVMQHVYFSTQPSTFLYEKKGMNFEFSINPDCYNFDLKVNEQIVNGEIEHLNDVKSYVLENDVDLKQERMLHDISNYLKLMKY